jgi:hypothetical protein
LAERVLEYFMLAVPAQYDWKIFFLVEMLNEENPG